MHYLYAFVSGGHTFRFFQKIELPNCSPPPKSKPSIMTLDQINAHRWRHHRAGLPSLEHMSIQPHTKISKDQVALFYIFPSLHERTPGVTEGSTTHHITTYHCCSRSYRQCLGSQALVGGIVKLRLVYLAIASVLGLATVGPNIVAGSTIVLTLGRLLLL